MLVGSAMMWHGPIAGDVDCEVTCKNWMAVRARNSAVDYLLICVCPHSKLVVWQVLVLWVLGSVCFGVSALAAVWRDIIAGDARADQAGW